MLCLHILFVFIKKKNLHQVTVEVGGKEGCRQTPKIVL